ncbi:unnamed protein product [Clonostachys rhizophaga]|uniref:Stc1 domain-containing protein n=1 Tax=Clonostachys rhizophaga TaxID=160324 RepID=A0A9N9VVJ4_9HYPO|nr:unnamed protein product [Clonostachys rhizophaga]
MSAAADPPLPPPHPPPGGPSGHRDGVAGDSAVTKRCTHCKQDKSIDQYVNLRNPAAKPTGKCLECHQKQSQTPTHRVFDSVRSRLSKRPSTEVQSPERQEARRFQPIVPRPEPPAITPTSATPSSSRLILPAPRTPNPLARAGTLVRSTTSSLPRFLRRGVDSQESPDTQQARRDQVAIQRRHRAERREGLEPSPTPGIPQLLGQSQGTPAPFGRVPESSDPDEEVCPQCHHLRQRGDFFDEDGTLCKECNVCRATAQSSQYASSQVSHPSTESSFGISGLALRPPQPRGNIPSSLSQTLSELIGAEEASNPGEIEQEVEFNNDLSAVALSDSDRQLIAA